MSLDDPQWLDRINPQQVDYVYDRLTNRERECLGLFLSNHSDQDIASRFYVLEVTVRRHISNICDKFKQLEQLTEINIGRLHLIRIFMRYRPEIVDINYPNSNPIRKPPISMSAYQMHEIIKNPLLNEIKTIIQLEEEINKGTNINERDDEGCTPLFIAIETKKIEVINFLIQQPDLDINAKNIYGWGPLHKAANTGCLAIVHRLLNDERTDPRVTTEMGATTVYEAAFGSDEVEIIRMLEERGVDINLPSNDRFTPFMVAIWRENYAIADYLIEQISTSNINQRDEKGETAFYKAVKQRNYDLVTKLIDKGVDYRIKPFPTSPNPEVDSLILAAERGDINTVQRFIDECHDSKRCLELINRRDSPYYRTALSLAAEKGHFEIVKLLVEAGANVFARNNHGRTPKEMVLRRNQHIIDYLTSAESNYTSGRE
ncbi:ankyrin repeat domain-containing protein [Nostoc sp. ChiSLP03a]|uniref:ankyrin repeat domain-containing protein n=1 Tax=Nostoc sp. ChiSLP03a TaxID=3075380 RepID=UPI002AD493E4|nr:ankyrin repeat domain-containing protein [Nostoc sp. ChiSLP03a]MDZ8210085.1 ankyrin repeat domain-containing protein [Nostoc sp. ChiSLP03a]